MKINKHIDDLTKFIVRRAFRCGTISRADILRVINISSATATRKMSEVHAKFSHILERKGQKIVPKPLAECPPYATEANLLTTLNNGQSNPLYTGLFENELPVTYVSWTNSMPSREGTLQTIVTAIRLSKQIDIVYLGIRLNEQPKKRKILPLSLEKMNDQWRVIAQDIDSKEFPVKVFVLPRILSASVSEVTKRIPFIKGYKDSKTKLDVILNHKYTPQQRQMLEHELMIKEGKVSVATRSLHEFKRRFMETPVSKDAVWPPLMLKEE